MHDHLHDPRSSRATHPRTGKAFLAGVDARREGKDFMEVVRLYRSPERRKAAIAGWEAQGRAEWIESLPTCSMCHQPVAPPTSKEAREELPLDDPWHPTNGLPWPFDED